MNINRIGRGIKCDNATPNKVVNSTINTSFRYESKYLIVTNFMNKSANQISNVFYKRQCLQFGDRYVIVKLAYSMCFKTAVYSKYINNMVQ